MQPRRPVSVSRQGSDRVLAAILAVLGPLVVLALAWGALQTWGHRDERRAMANAGRVLNARLAEGGDVVAAMERTLAEHEPEVLLLGPSYANTDVNAGLLADRLGLARDDVLLFSIPNSIGAHWYAILKHRVFARGHRPRLVVVVSGMQSMLLATPLTESSYVNLAVHLDAPDPVVADKVRADTRLALARLRERRAGLREAFFALAHAPAAALRPGGLRPHQVRGALDRVFDDANVDMRLHHRGSPVVEPDRLGAWDPTLLPEVDRSFVPDVTGLAVDHGARVVWVRPPMSPDIPAALDDVVPPDREAALPAAVEALGGTFLDLRHVPVPADEFKNEDHMNAEGSRRFTEALAEALLAVDALGREEPVGALPPVAPAVELLDPPGPVPPDAAAWPGEGRWVGPGATLRVRVPGWEAARGPLAVAIAAEQRVGGADPVVTVAGQPVELVRRARTTHHLLGARAVVRRPDGPFTIDVRVPDDGVWTRVTGLAIGERAATVRVVGDASAIDGRRAPLLGGSPRDGAIETVRPTFHAPPGRVPGADRPVLDGPDAIGRYDTAPWAFLSDERLVGEAGGGCSPLRITEDGVALPHPNAPCLDVHREGGGRSCHTPENIWFTTVDGSDPATNGRAYRLVLDEARRCGDAVWLYPKDAFHVAWPADRLAALRRGADTLRFGARYLQKRPTTVEIVLRVDGEERLRRQIAGHDLDGEALTFPLDPPVAPDARVVLEVTNPAMVFHLITEATLSEGGAG